MNRATPLVHETVNTHVALRSDPLNPTDLLNFVKRPTAGATVLFAGTTRTLSRPEGAYVPAPSAGGTSTTSPPVGSAGHLHTFKNWTGPSAPDVQDDSYAPIASLTYTSYAPLAMRTLTSIASDQLQKHKLEAVAVEHRLGAVPVGEESVIVAVSAMHRGAAWAGGEECMEEVKRRVEIWKWEVFEEGVEGWRGNATDGGGRAESGS